MSPRRSAAISQAVTVTSILKTTHRIFGLEKWSFVTNNKFKVLLSTWSNTFWRQWILLFIKKMKPRILCLSEKYRTGWLVRQSCNMDSAPKIEALRKVQELVLAEGVLMTHLRKLELKARGFQVFCEVVPMQRVCQEEPGTVGHVSGCIHEKDILQSEEPIH